MTRNGDENLRFMDRFNTHRYGNFSQYILWYPPFLILINKLVKLIQGRIHKFHAYPTVSFFKEGSIKLNNEGAFI